MLDQGQNRMWGRYFAFLALSMLIIVANLYIASLFAPAPQNVIENQRQDHQRVADQSQAAEKLTLKGESKKHHPDSGATGVAKDTEAAEAPAEASPQGAQELPPAPRKYVTIGSFDPQSGYRMLITLCSRGASVARIELNSPRYCDTEFRGGYVGTLFFEGKDAEKGLTVDVVGPGTPAAIAGILPGDVILSLNGKPVADLVSFERILLDTRPGQRIPVEIQRNGRRVSRDVVLRRPPVVLVRREQAGPHSFEMTLSALDDRRLMDIRAPLEEQLSHTADVIQKEILHLRWLHAELENIQLKSQDWYVLAENADPRDPSTWTKPETEDRVDRPRESIRFAQYLPDSKLVIVKTYRLASVKPEKISDHDDPSYHFGLEVSVLNLDNRKHRIAYELDGPNGLPTEGAWYARKMSNSWSAVGLRDVAVKIGTGSLKLVPCPAIAADRWGAPWKDTADQLITALGVDAQYFSVILLPRRGSQPAMWIEEARPLRIGAVEPGYEYLTNVSCRITSVPFELNPGDVVAHNYTVFAGPKRSDLLAQYELEGLIQYGWFWFVADPMTRLLHIFHDYLVFNYGLAIILLTVVVRVLMLPISRKQALNAQKMQELQPELKKIQERYKDLQERNRATQELFRQHKYNPFSGCLVLFIQLPIFIGLYKALAIDVELRQAPLISENIRWCSNLAAPDMLFDWSFLWPEWFNRGHGMFGLGPYFNLLPILTIAIFLWQQKKMMPPPADEQAALQQKIMNIMMIFMGILFYKVPSGLCLYFIASSLWGMAEREILLKTIKKPTERPKRKRDWMQLWRKVQDLVPDWLKQVVKAADKRYAEKLPREQQRPAKRTKV